LAARFALIPISKDTEEKALTLVRFGLLEPICRKGGVPRSYDLRMVLRRKDQLENDSFVRCIAVMCVLLALVMTGVEAMHAHTDASISRNSSPCAICLSAHAKALTITVQFLPVIYTVESLAVTYESQGKSPTPDLSLFIRPPPYV
jgi:hypothetical protein